MNSRDRAYSDAINARCDAAMKYLGRRIVERDGKKYEGIERESLGVDVPESAHMSIRKLIDAEKKKSGIQRRRKSFRKIAKVCAIALVLLSVSGAILINTVDAFKYRFHDFVIVMQNNFLHLTPDEGLEEPSGPEYWHPEYLPGGFVMDQAVSDAGAKITTFKNAGGKVIKIYQRPADGASLYLDDKGSEGIIIKGNYNGYLTENEGGIFLYWVQDDYMISVAGDIGFDEILKVAESLKRKK